MITCPKCGTPYLDDNTIKCPRCGINPQKVNRFSKEMVCMKCGSRMVPKSSFNCSIIVLILLLLLGIIPGLLYLGICLAMSKRACSVCGATETVPLNTPAAQKIISARDAD